MSDAVTPFQAPIGTHDVLCAGVGRVGGRGRHLRQLAYRYGLLARDLARCSKTSGSSTGASARQRNRQEGDVRLHRPRQRTYALRPEGTASVVRAFVQHNPTTPWKAWYVDAGLPLRASPGRPLSPAPPTGRRGARHRRPGRRRRGHRRWPSASTGPSASRGSRLLVNSMGHDVCRAAYVDAAARAPRGQRRANSATSTAHVRENPLRVLDCKDPACIAVTEDGPMLIDHSVTTVARTSTRSWPGLTSIGIESRLDPRLVRGFDYYTRTTFEFTADALDGAQNAIGGGGRYDGCPSSSAASRERHRLRQRHRATAADARGRRRRTAQPVNRARSTSSSSTRPARTSRRCWSTSCARPASRRPGPTTTAR
jgi:histidyl-tRNA synthetase